MEILPDQDAVKMPDTAAAQLKGALADLVQLVRGSLGGATRRGSNETHEEPLKTVPYPSDRPFAAKKVWPKT